MDTNMQLTINNFRQLFPDKIFSLTFSKIPDIFLTAVKFPDISSFSRQVVSPCTHAVIGQWRFSAHYDSGHPLICTLLHLILIYLSHDQNALNYDRNGNIWIMIQLHNNEIMYDFETLLVHLYMYIFFHCWLSTKLLVALLWSPMNSRSRILKNTTFDQTVPLNLKTHYFANN